MSHNVHLLPQSVPGSELLELFWYNGQQAQLSVLLCEVKLI